MFSFQIEKRRGQGGQAVLFSFRIETLKYDLYLVLSIWVFVTRQSNESNKREENMFVTKQVAEVLLLVRGRIHFQTSCTHNSHVLDELLHGCYATKTNLPKIYYITKIFTHLLCNSNELFRKNVIHWSLRSSCRHILFRLQVQNE